MKHYLAVVRKEWLDARRDTRALFSAFFFSLFGPLMIAFVVTMLADQVEDPGTSELHVVGAQYAPALVDELEEAGVKVTKVEEAGADTVRNGDADAVLVIPENFKARYMENAPVRVEFYRDGSERTEGRDIDIALRRYSSSVAQARLLTRGVPVTHTQPLIIDERDVSSGGRIGSVIADMIMYFFILAPFFGGLGVAMDMTAGERERDSLQPLMVQPVKPLTLILGKWTNALIFSMLGAVLTVGFGIVALDFAPLENLGASLVLGPAQGLQMILVMLPVAFMATALQITISLASKNLKEAQTYLGLLNILPVGIGVYSFYGDTSGAMEYIPISLQLNQLKSISFGETLDPVQTIIGVATCFAVALVLLAYSARMLRQERMLSPS